MIFGCPTAKVYEYIGTYVDNLCIVMKDSEGVLELLQTPEYGNFQLKWFGLFNFHLGCGFLYNTNGNLCMDARKYVKKMVKSYKQLF